MGHPGAASRPTCKHRHPYPKHLAYDFKGHAVCTECARTRKRDYRANGPSTPDPVAIERAVAGDPPERLTPRERQAAVIRLTARALSARQIAERVGCAERTVHRIRSRHATAA